MKTVAQNKKAYHDYEILETIEVGIVLTGDEVKSLRASSVSMAGSFATIHKGELYLINCHIGTYGQAYRKDEKLATRRRKLLLHRRELNKVIGLVSQRGVTLVPLKIYFNKRNIAKISLGLCKHKKAPSKKRELKERDIKRETRRELKEGSRS